MTKRSKFACMWPYVAAGCECNAFAYAPGEMPPPDYYGHHPACPRHEHTRLYNEVDEARARVLELEQAIRELALVLQ